MLDKYHWSIEGVVLCTGSRFNSITMNILFVYDQALPRNGIDALVRMGPMNASYSNSEPNNQNGIRPFASIQTCNPEVRFGVLVEKRDDCVSPIVAKLGIGRVAELVARSNLVVELADSFVCEFGGILPD